MSSKGPARPRLPIGLRPLESTGNATDIVRIEGRVDAQGGDLTATRVQFDRRIAAVELELATVSGRGSTEP